MNVILKVPFGQFANLFFMFSRIFHLCELFSLRSSMGMSHAAATGTTVKPFEDIPSPRGTNIDQGQTHRILTIGGAIRKTYTATVLFIVPNSFWEGRRKSLREAC